MVTVVVVAQRLCEGWGDNAELKWKEPRMGSKGKEDQEEKRKSEWGV